MFGILFQENSYSFSVTLAAFKNRKKPSSSGLKINSACPVPVSPRAVRPTRWMYSRVSSGGSNCTIQSTCGMSSPLAATSVHSRIPLLASQNEKKVQVRFCCFCLPWKQAAELQRLVELKTYMNAHDWNVNVV